MIDTSAQTANLRESEAKLLVGWFLYTMPQDQRARMMAELPQLYAKLYPGVSQEIVTGRVAGALRDQAKEKT